jgi:hypothetical protein
MLLSKETKSHNMDLRTNHYNSPQTSLKKNTNRMAEQTKERRQVQYLKEGSHVQVTNRSLRIIHEDIVTRKQLSIHKPYYGKAALRSSNSMPKLQAVRQESKKRHRSNSRKARQIENDVAAILRTIFSMPEFQAVQAELKKRNRAAYSPPRSGSLSPRPRSSSLSSSRMIPKKSPLARYKKQWRTRSLSSDFLDASQHSASSIQSNPVRTQSENSIEEESAEAEEDLPAKKKLRKESMQLAELAFLLSNQLSMAVDGGVYKGNSPTPSSHSRPSKVTACSA